jgi:hypothetical protein
MSCDIGSCFESSHFAIASVQQALAFELRTYALYEREIQGIVRTIAWDNVAGDELTGGLGRSGHEFELGEVGTMIFAMAELKDAIGGDLMIAKGSGAIESDTVERDFIHFARVLPQVGFESGPVSFVTAAENNTEAIIGELDGPERLAESRFEGVLMTAGPILRGNLAMVGLGKDEGEPDGGEPTIGNTLMEMMGAQVFLQDLRETQLLHQAEK